MTATVQDQPIDLDPRAREILRDVIASYILTGEPVGSRAIAKMSREHLSAASIRNVMADLEEMGLLAQPHTSAGRVPTDRGYRYYVDTLLPEARVARRDRELIAASLAGVGAEPSEAMENIPKLLSRLTRLVGCLVSPALGDAVLKQIEFMRLQQRRVLTVVVDRSGVVSHRVLEMDQDYSASDLERAGRYLTEEFAGKPLREIRAQLVALMAEEKAAFDRLVNTAVTLGTKYLEQEPDQRRLVIEGATNMLKHPEFADVEAMKRLFDTFEEKHRLVSLLDRCLDQPGVQVVIGSEADDPALTNLALVVSPYRLGEKATGVLGIVGPTRMEYDRAVALVGYISRLFSDLLTDPNP